MTKKEIVKTISEEIGLTQLKTKEIVQKTFDAIVETLVEDGRIELRNFGVFEVKRRAARKARNPRTGQRVDVPEKFVVTFKPGKEMEERVRHLSEAAKARAGLLDEEDHRGRGQASRKLPGTQCRGGTGSSPTGRRTAGGCSQRLQLGHRARDELGQSVIVEDLVECSRTEGTSARDFARTTCAGITSAIASISRRMFCDASAHLGCAVGARPRFGDGLLHSDLLRRSRARTDQLIFTSEDLAVADVPVGTDLVPGSARSHESPQRVHGGVI